MNYINCNLKGGLGNMMFQIAATHAFALDAGCDSNFPNLHSQFISLNNDQHHNPALNYATEYMKIFHRLNTYPLANGCGYAGFPFHYEKKIVPPNTRVDGFFQSEKYFLHRRKEVLDLFDFSFLTDEFIKTKYPMLLDGTRTTSIHVRRGDYLRNPLCHHPQSANYYRAGIDVLKDDTDMLVCFSDDIQWCKEQFKYPNIIFVEGEKDYTELALMSRCSNHITSNSSFSWWGAWMNNNSNKKVVGPRIWFGPILACHNISDILPQEWIKL